MEKDKLKVTENYAVGAEQKAKSVKKWLIIFLWVAGIVSVLVVGGFVMAGIYEPSSSELKNTFDAKTAKLQKDRQAVLDIINGSLKESELAQKEAEFNYTQKLFREKSAAVVEIPLDQKDTYEKTKQEAEELRSKLTQIEGQKASIQSKKADESVFLFGSLSSPDQKQEPEQAKSQEVAK